MPKWVRKLIRRMVLVPSADPQVDPRFVQLMNSLIDNGNDLTAIDEHVIGLVIENHKYAIETQTELRKRTVEGRVLYGIAILLAIGGAYLYGDVSRQANTLTLQQKVIASQQKAIASSARNLVFAEREGCERINIVRANQADVLKEQNTITRAFIAGPLGQFEGIREQIESSIAKREIALDVLRESVKDYPDEGNPYHVNCQKAYPFAPRVRNGRASKEAARKQRIDKTKG